MAERDYDRRAYRPWRSKGGRNNTRKPQHQLQQQQPEQGFVFTGRTAPATHEPPRLSELQHQNRIKTRRFFLKKKPLQVITTPHAPRNTSSFIMRAKTSGGIASFVSPTPLTPAVLATPDLSKEPPYRGGIVDEVNQEWGVNGYGSMNGLIRLRTAEDTAKDESESDSDVDQGIQSVQQLEQRLDHDLNRFEIVYPPELSGFGVAGTQLEDQENHIAHLEEENLTLKERIFILEQQVDELKQQLKLQEAGETMEDEMEVCSTGNESTAAR